MLFSTIEKGIIMSDRKFEYEFHEEFLPPRCRKPRYRWVQGVLEYDFRRLSSDDAPVVIVQHNCMPRLTCLGAHQDYGNGKKIEYRWHGNKLWVPVRLSRMICLNGKRNRQATIKDVYIGSIQYHDLNDEQAVKNAIRNNLDSKWVLIDGVLHALMGEPMFVVQTFGLGCNHGGTAILVDNSYNPNIASQCYFRIDEREKALKFFRETAIGRGDTKSLKNSSSKADTFDILDSSVLKRHPAKDHGHGVPFINSVEDVVKSVKNPTLAGFAALALAMK